MVTSSDEVESKEKEGEEGGNGFPSFSDFGIPSSTVHFDVSFFLCISIDSACMLCVQALIAVVMYGREMRSKCLKYI